MRTAVSIDIGGTHTKLALVSDSGRISHRLTLDTRSSRSIESYLSALFEAIAGLVTQAASENMPAKGIGIGAPACNEHKGTIAHAANLLFKEPFPIRQEVSERFSLPVILLKDSSAAALGEQRHGGAGGMQNFALITLGTGLGSGLICEGKLVRGARGLASEFGHAIVDPGGRECGCGRRGCLETYVSATGIVRTAFALLAERKADSVLRGMSYRDTTAEDLFMAAGQKDPIALEAFERTGKILGLKLNDLVVAFEPEAIFLSGGLARAGELLLEPARKALQEHALHLMRGKVKLLLSELGAHDAALLGAGCTILHQQKEKIS